MSSIFDLKYSVLVWLSHYDSSSQGGRVAMLRPPNFNVSFNFDQGLKGEMGRQNQIVVKEETLWPSYARCDVDPVTRSSDGYAFITLPLLGCIRC